MGAESVDSIVQILIIGGGFAALEAVLALRALLGERALMTLVAPEPHLAYRPAATLEAFAENDALHRGPPQRTYDLRAICEDLGVTYRRDRLEAVAPKQHRVRLASFARPPYDSLLLALGARATVAVPGALTFRDQRDVPQLRRLLAEVRAGEIEHLAFAVPSGCTWALPLYELALMTAAFAKRHRVRLDLSLLTPEQKPLELFGHEASELIAGVLADRGVRFRGGSVPASLDADGALALHFNGAIRADRVVCAPQLRGANITGLPSDWWGFLATDPRGRVEGLSDVYAAGDMTAFPIKQGGLAAQQADVIAQNIAALHGVHVDGPHVAPERVMRARLLGGSEHLFLRVVLDEYARPSRATLHVEASSSSAAADEDGSLPDEFSSVQTEKVFGRHLTSYLRDIQPLAAAS